MSIRVSRRNPVAASDQRRDDEDENAERKKGEVVPAQTPPGEEPGAAAADRLRLPHSEIGRRVEGELRLSLLGHLPPSARDVVGAPPSGAPTDAAKSDYLWQIVEKSNW